MENIKITVYPKNTSPNLLANANISVETARYGFITIKGFCIWKSDHLNERLQECMNITPPSRAAYGRRIQIAFFEDPKKWEEVEMLIYSEFCRVRSGIDSDTLVEDINNKLNSNSD